MSLISNSRGFYVSVPFIGFMIILITIAVSAMITSDNEAQLGMAHALGYNERLDFVTEAIRLDLFNVMLQSRLQRIIDAEGAFVDTNCILAETPYLTPRQIQYIDTFLLPDVQSRFMSFKEDLAFLVRKHMGRDASQNIEAGVDSVLSMTTSPARAYDKINRVIYLYSAVETFEETFEFLAYYLESGIFYGDDLTNYDRAVLALAREDIKDMKELIHDMREELIAQGVVTCYGDSVPFRDKIRYSFARAMEGVLPIYRVSYKDFGIVCSCDISNLVSRTHVDFEDQSVGEIKTIVDENALMRVYVLINQYYMTCSSEEPPADKNINLEAESYLINATIMCFYGPSACPFVPPEVLGRAFPELDMGSTAF